MKIFFTYLLFLTAISVSAQSVDISVDGDGELCLGESVTITANVLGMADSLRWTPTEGIPDPTAEVITVMPMSNTTYAVTVYFGQQTVSDSVEILVDEYYFPEVIDDTTICEGTEVALAAAVPSSPTVYTWTPAEGLSDSSLANPVATPVEDTEYTLVAVSENGICTDTATVMVTVLPARLEIQEADTAFICKGSSVTINTDFRPFDATISWSPPEGLNQTNGGTVIASPEVTHTYMAELVTPDGCVIRDTVTVRVDSLPELDITAVPGPMQPCNKYCPNTIVTLFSQPVDEDKYPDIMYGWEPDNGTFRDSLDYKNTAIETQFTTEYIRTNTNNACVETDTILIEVILPSIPLNVEDTTVCPGQAVNIMADMPEDLSMIEWTSEPPGNEQYLSCTDCPDPTITIGTAGDLSVVGEYTFIIKATKEMCCPAEGMVKITVDFEEIPTDTVNTCEGTDVPISAHPSVQSVIWNDNPAADIDCLDCLTTTATVSSNAILSYTGINDEGCTVVGDVFIEFYPSPTFLDLAVSTHAVAVGGTVQAVLQAVPLPADTNAIVWMVNGATVSPDNLNVELLIEDSGQNIIKASYTDINGCMRMDTAQVTGVEPMYAVPKAFTPNNDEVNDFFKPVVTNAEDFEEDFVTSFRIWNRWGELVYDNDDNAQGWDGMQDGEAAPSDVYVYIIEVTLPGGEILSFKGDVTLLR